MAIFFIIHQFERILRYSKEMLAQQRSPNISIHWVCIQKCNQYAYAAIRWSNKNGWIVESRSVLSKIYHIYHGPSFYMCYINQTWQFGSIEKNIALGQCFFSNTSGLYKPYRPLDHGIYYTYIYTNIYTYVHT